MSETCLLCGGSSHHLISKKYGFDIVRCLDCGLVSVSPLPTKEQLAAYYKREYDHFRHSFSTPHTEPPKRKLPELRILERYCPPGKLLDVGSSHGHFIDNAHKYGWDVEGVEPHDESRIQSQSRSQHAVHELLSEAPDNSFDALTMWHVIEHISAPTDFLTEATRKLVPGGILALATPNVDSLVAKATGESWSWLSPPDHLYLYSPKTLPLLLHQTGFEVLHIETRRGRSRNFILLMLQAVVYRLGLFQKVKGSAQKAAHKFRASQSNVGKISIFFIVEKLTEALSLLLYPATLITWKLGLGEEVLAIARKSGTP